MSSKWWDEPGAIFVALGANLADPSGSSPLETCQAAAAALGAIAGLRLEALSRWWVSAAIPPSAQPDYINAVARLSGSIRPEELLASLQGLERQHGRLRSGRRDEARPLDLDILAMGTLVRAHPDPILPHPRMHLRRFVLAPLAEVAPGWVHPALGQTVEMLLAALPVQTLRPLERAAGAARERSGRGRACAGPGGG